MCPCFRVADAASGCFRGYPTLPVLFCKVFQKLDLPGYLEEGTRCKGSVGELDSFSYNSGELERNSDISVQQSSHELEVGGVGVVRDSEERAEEDVGAGQTPFCGGGAPQGGKLSGVDRGGPVGGENEGTVAEGGEVGPRAAVGR